MAGIRGIVRVATLMAVGLLPAVLIATAPVQPRLLGMLRLGAWDLRFRDQAVVKRSCLPDGAAFIQLRHRARSCEWLVLDQTPTSLLVQYTCKGHGFGRTQLRRETSQLVQIETQGVADGLPFEESIEGRWVGECIAAGE